jgi:hypothetical protein
MRNERHKLRVLGDDPARLPALLRNEGAGQALAAIGKEPASSFDPFDDLTRNDRDADDLRMRMLLRRAGIYAVILEDDYMPHARVRVKLQEPMAVGLQNPLHMHPGTTPWSHRAEGFRSAPREGPTPFTLTSPGAAQPVRATSPVEESTENLLTTERRTHRPSSPSNRNRSSAVIASLPGQNIQLARNGGTTARSVADARFPPRFARSGAMMTHSPVSRFSRISDMAGESLRY